MINQLTEWNPQLFRELKGRLKVRNVAITAGISLVGQLLFFLTWTGNASKRFFSIQAPYCRLRETFSAAARQYNLLHRQSSHLNSRLSHYSSSKHYDPQKVQELKAKIALVKDKIEDLEPLVRDNGCPTNAIDFQLWWQDYYLQMFLWLSLGLMFVLLVVGSYMLISDLAQEERRGTLNFIRLSPGSTTSILGGKLLGVPILLYLAAVLAVPLHLWLGLSGHVPLTEIFSFWVVLIVSCLFFYSLALLFGLVSSGLGGFQAWLGSGALLFFLIVINNQSLTGHPEDWLKLFCPSIVLPYLVNHIGERYIELPFARTSPETWDWFYFPIGAPAFRVVICALVNYGLWTFWSWQALKRRFRNPNSTILSKRQSYGLVACWSLVTLSFALQTPSKGSESFMVFASVNSLLTLHLVLFVVLIATLSPHSQTLQDWARYRGLGVRDWGLGTGEKSRVKGQKSKFSGLQDLIWGEKSPAVLAIAINLVICMAPIVGWILLWKVDINRREALAVVVLILNLILIYAAMTQLILLMKTPKRTIWAAAFLASATVLLPLILEMLSIQVGKDGGGLWLLTTFPWRAIHQASTTLVFQVCLVEWSILGLLTWQLSRQLRKAGN